MLQCVIAKEGNLFYYNIFSQVPRRCPCSRSLCTLIPTSEELRPPRLKKGQRVAQGPWWESCVFGPNEEAFRPQYWRDLGAVEEQRRGEQNLEDPDVVFPTSVTLMCFKVKVGAVLPPLLLSFVYLFCQFTMFQSLVKRHWWGSDCSESFGNISRWMSNSTHFTFGG